MASVSVISPAGVPHAAHLNAHLAELKLAGWGIDYHPLTPHSEWPYYAGSLDDRLHDLLKAVENDNPFILCARGGYGASDLLPYIPWDRLTESPPKCLIGFSDISALLMAFYTQLGWAGIHGPMPGSPLWVGIDRPDITKLRSLMTGRPYQGSCSLIPLNSQAHPRAPIAGTMLGGCFSVLTNLIGTPYLKPTHVDGAVLFFEDIEESPQRLLRSLNQWRQSGYLDRIQALVWGDLAYHHPLSEEASLQLKRLLSRELSVPCYSTQSFGHVTPNEPLILGAQTLLQSSHETTYLWQWSLNQLPRTYS